MKIFQNIGLSLFMISLLIFVGMLGLGTRQIDDSVIPGKNKYQK